MELQEYTEELHEIQDQFKLFGEAELINKEDISLSSTQSMSSVSTCSTGTGKGSSSAKVH